MVARRRAQRMAGSGDRRGRQLSDQQPVHAECWRFVGLQFRKQPHLSLALTFDSAFAGDKTVFMWVRDRGGLSSEWETRGTWNVPPAVVAASRLFE